MQVGTGGAEQQVARRCDEAMRTFPSRPRHAPPHLHANSAENARLPSTVDPDPPPIEDSLPCDIAHHRQRQLTCEPCPSAACPVKGKRKSGQPRDSLPKAQPSTRRVGSTSTWINTAASEEVVPGYSSSPTKERSASWTTSLDRPPLALWT